MSDLKRLFEHAPEGATRKVKFERERWMNEYGELYVDGRWVMSADPSEWQTIATRPQPEEAIRFKVGDKVKRVRGTHKGMHIGDCATVASLSGGKAVVLKEYGGTHSPDMLDLVTEQPRKTVEDAVEWVNGEWPSDDFIGIAYCNDENKFIPYMKGSRIDLGERKSRKSVCTREEFEACVAAKAANSEPEWTHEYRGERCKIQGEVDCFGRIVILTESGAYFLDESSSLEPIKPTITKAAAWDYAVDSGLYAEEIEKKYTITS